MEKAITPISLPGNRNNGFTFMELMVVMIIIAVMSALVYPSFKRGMESIKEQKKKAYLELLFKRALVQSRFDGKARVIKLNRDGNLLLNGKKLKKSVKGIKELKMNGKKVDTLAILPASFFTVSIVFEDYTYTIDLYTGETEVKKE